MRRFEVSLLALKTEKGKTQGQGVQELRRNLSQQPAKKQELQIYDHMYLNSTNSLNKLGNRFFPRPSRQDASWPIKLDIGFETLHREPS